MAGKKAKTKTRSTKDPAEIALKTRTAVAEKVTSQILELLDRGELPPWEKGWRNSQTGRARNAVTNRLYRGMNVWITTLTQLAEGYSDPRWLTFDQALELGGNVRKGEKGTQIHLAKPWVPKRNKDAPADDAAAPEQNGEETGKTKVIHIWRSFHVFNVEQTEGCNLAPIEVETTRVHDPVAAAEEIIENMPQRPPVKEYPSANHPPHYNIGRDIVNVPTRERYERIEDWYNTVFHELVHATGHQSRLGRFEPGKHNAFASHDYGCEELIAGMGSAMLGEIAGIGHMVIERDAAYIKGWRDIIAADRTMVLTAAGKAQTAVDFITDTSIPESQEEKESKETERELATTAA